VARSLSHLIAERGCLRKGANPPSWGALTNSTLPALPVHVVGEVLFFTLIWPHNAGRALVWTHGADATFWVDAAQALVFAVLAVIALRRLRNISRQTPRTIAQPDQVDRQRLRSTGSDVEAHEDAQVFARSPLWRDTTLASKSSVIPRAL
jgi:hypothetical protein